MGIKFATKISGFPEDLDKASFDTPISYIKATCKGKTDALLKSMSNNDYDVLVTADTVVLDKDNNIIEKPESEDQHFEFIKILNGGWSTIITVLNVTRKKGQEIQTIEKIDTCKLKMVAMEDQVIRKFVQMYPENRFAY